MAVQAFRSEQIHHELTGKPLTLQQTGAAAAARSASAAPSMAGWKLEASDIRAGIQQRLRVSRTWVAAHAAAGLFTAGPSAPSQQPQTFRWYFLTEDNHWAPLDAKDMAKLDECYESVTS